MQVAGRIPRRGHGPALEPAAPHRCARLRPRRPEDADAPVPGPRAWCQGRYPRWRRAPRRLALGPSSRPKPRCQLENQGSSRLPVCLARLTGECSLASEHGRDVGFEPTTLRLET